MASEESARKIVSQMYENDPFSQWMGIERLNVGPGYCVLRMKIRREMLNGFGIAHGGITFSLADSALAFASNSQGRHAVSIDTSISHIASLQEGDVITATAIEEQLGHRIGHYRVEVRNEEKEMVALFRGIVYRRSTEW
ncbi:MAG: hydroxyphenylacetyl-CoA thioesterase PaaI [Phaeodactylibacter sp.]|nr:hydroxyphenylacetyl-CoA thioesterase PaaI [Phaeodactylibacter sp.]MCB9285903.1 hydroxyphenylacetyl-CoA thioesterase PaaI [Lewinellaceae bacterium]